MHKLWFKRKLYGWGWTPATWEGWVITVFYILSVIFFIADMDTASSAVEVAVNLGIPVVVLTVIFLLIAFKTGERPRWQWGKRLED